MLPRARKHQTEKEDRKVPSLTLRNLHVGRGRGEGRCTQEMCARTRHVQRDETCCTSSGNPRQRSTYFLSEVDVASLTETQKVRS